MRLERVVALMQRATQGVGTEALTTLLRAVAEETGGWNALVVLPPRSVPTVLAHAPHERAPKLPADLDLSKNEWQVIGDRAWRVVELPVPELYYILRVAPEQTGEPHWELLCALAILLARHEAFHRELSALKRLSERRVQALGTLYETALASVREDIDQFMQILTRRAAQAMDAQACSLMLLNHETKELRVVASYGIPADKLPEARTRLGEGIAGKVAELGEPMIITDPTIEPRLKGVVRRPEISGSICVPLRDQQNQMMGVLTVRRLHPSSSFTQEDLRLFTIFANQVALAIENARLYQKLNQNIRRLETLVDLAQKVTAVLDIDSLLEMVATQIREQVGFSRCAIFLQGDNSRVLVPRYIEGYRPEMFSPRGIRKGQGAIGMVAKKRMPVIVDDARSEVQPLRGFGRAIGANRYCVLPIVVHGNCIGVVLADNADSDQELREDQVELLAAFVSQAGIAIENARLYREMEQRYQEIQNLAAFRNNILRSLGSGMFTIDTNGYITTWNRTAKGITGLSAHEVVNRHYTELLQRAENSIHPSAREEMRKVVESVLQGQGTHHLYKVPFHRGNETRLLNFIVTPLAVGLRQTQGAVVVFEDITEQVHLEARLREMERLAEIGQMTATIAHEIRNPLTAIKGAVDLLAGETDPENIAIYSDVLSMEVARLTEIADEFLEFARPFHLNIRPEPLRPLLERIFRFLSAFFQENSVQARLEMESDVIIPMDPNRIEQALRNLIHNAVQAMPQGGQITVEVCDADEWVVIHVHDTGSGIPPDTVEKIFSPFFTTRTRGTGLGLSIVKKIVDGHRGKIAVQSTLGKGSTFSLWLPKLNREVFGEREAPNHEQSNSLGGRR